jgi:hypothetical protein
MTAAKVNLKEGKRNAIWFVLGAIIIIFQAFVAILFARVINVRPDIYFTAGSRFCSFGALTVYFYGSPKCLNLKKSKIKSSKKTFSRYVTFST